MQTNKQQTSASADLRGSLEAYFSKRVDFDALRTQWIITLADNPGLCAGAVRLLYRKDAARHLGEERTLSLKRIVEAAVTDGPEDWTVTFDDDDDRRGVNARAPIVTLEAGQVLKNRFVLEEELGSGGSGIVFRAHDRLLQRAEAGPARIAIKVLREEFRTDPGRLKVLQREAGHAQGLSHPNIVRIYDLHQHGETYFITMELLQGETLKALLSKSSAKPMRQDRVIRIILNLCRGLSYAHERGLVHADFKPGNVILAPGDEPKILDFGLSQVAASFSQRAAGSDALQALTPAYASCNRLEGRAPTFSDDVYSLSCVIYELLSGRHPYDRKSALAARALNLVPARIDDLTDIEWRTLANGLRFDKEERSTQVHDLQVAFSPIIALYPAGNAAKIPPSVPVSKPVAPKKPAAPRRAKVRHRKASKNTPAQIRKGRRGSRKASGFGWLFTVAVVAGLAAFVSQPIGQRYLKTAIESQPVKALRAGVVDRLDALGSSKDNAVAGSAASTADSDIDPIGATENSVDTTVPASENPVGGDTLINETGTLQAASNQPASAEPGPGTMTPAANERPAASADSLQSPPGGQPAPVAETRASGVAADDSAKVPAENVAAVVAPGFRFDAAEYVVDERAAAVAVQINRQGDSSSAASVDWTIVPASAQPEQDYIGGGLNRAFFAAGETKKTLFIPIVSDAMREPDESFRIALSRPEGNRILSDPFTATVIIVDDD